MGYQMTAVLLKRTDQGCEEIPNPFATPEKWADKSDIPRCYFRDATFKGNHAWDFLGLDSEVSVTAKPVDLSALTSEQLEDLEVDTPCRDGGLWQHEISDLLAVDWNVVYWPWPSKKFNRPRTETRREILGDAFIRWISLLKELGVDRIVVSFA